MRRSRSYLGDTVERFHKLNACTFYSLCLFASLDAALIALFIAFRGTDSVTDGVIAPFIIATILGAVAAYAFGKIHAWIRSVPEPCYQLQQRDGPGGTWKTVQAPAEVIDHPFDEVDGSGSINRAVWEAKVTETEAARRNTRVLAVYSDRLGNHVFQYALARLRAAFLDVSFAAPPLGGPFKPAATEVERWRDLSYPSLDLKAPRHSLLLRSRECCGQSGSASPCPHASSGLLSSVWQRAWHAWMHTPTCRYTLDTTLFAGCEGEIAGWLRPGLDAAAEAATVAADSAGDASWGPRDVAVHIRVGDILWGHHTAYRPLPMSFYQSALHTVAAQLPAPKSTSGATSPIARSSQASEPSATTCSQCGAQHPPLGKVVIVTEDPKHEIIRRTAEHFRSLLCCGDQPLCSGGVEIVSGSLSGDLTLLYTAPALVLSVSSFAWWPAFLSRTARPIIVPSWGLLKAHYWKPSPRRNPQLFMRHDMTVRPLGPQWSEMAERSDAAVSAIGALIMKAVRVRGDALEEDVEKCCAKGVTIVKLDHLPHWPGPLRSSIDGLFNS